MATLPELLERLEESVAGAGGVVHWARDAAEANAVVAGIARGHGISKVIKVKSIATDEIGLNAALAAEGIAAVETDLAELINQLAGDWSSHILVPAIHRNRAEIRRLFEATIAAGRTLSDEPAALAEAARLHLREKFLSTPMAVSGANFGIAGTGTVCVVESEGNGRMCTTLPEVLVTVMGIEKLLPQWRDLEVFLQLLSRSATGELHPLLGLPQRLPGLHAHRRSCLRVGLPRPIGAIPTPMLAGLHAAPTLPFASSLCGACLEVCPVKIDIPTVLVHLRGRVVREEKGRLDPERLAMDAIAAAFGSRRRYERAQRLARLGRGPVAEALLSRWTAMRELPGVPGESFRKWWRGRRTG